MTIQTEVLREVFDCGNKTCVKDLVLFTKFDKKQIYKALDDLKRRRLIIKKKESEYPNIRNPSKKKLYIEINENVFDRIKRILGENNGKKLG